MPSGIIQLKLDREKMVDRFKIPADTLDAERGTDILAVIDYDHKRISTIFGEGEPFSTGVSEDNFSELARFFHELSG